MIVNGTRFDLYINGNWEYGFDDASISSGRIGCMAYAGPLFDDAHWIDNVRFLPE